MCAEFNFACDPEAAYIVLNDYLCPTYIACWEFTCRSKLPWVSLEAFKVNQIGCMPPKTEISQIKSYLL